MIEHRLQPWLRRYGGLLFAVALVNCGLAVVAFDAPQPLRALAAGLVLWAPGYAFSAAVLVRGAIGAVERTLIAFAASIALTMIPAVVLEACGVPLDTRSFLVTVWVATSLSAAVALVRRPSPFPSARAPRAWRLAPAPIAVAVGIGLVLAGSLALARIPPQPSGIPGSSSLAATSAGPRLAQAEVISAELHATTYRVTMTTSTGALELDRFTLPPGGRWTRVVYLPTGRDAVQLVLHRGAATLPYRTVVVPAGQA